MAMMSFVGYANSLVAESRILDELPTAIFTRRDVICEDAAVIENIAGKKASLARKRNQDENDLNILKGVLETLKGFSKP